MLQAQLRDLPQRRRELVEATGSLQAAHRIELDVSSTSRTHEVGVVGVRQAVRPRLGRSEDDLPLRIVALRTLATDGV